MAFDFPIPTFTGQQFNPAGGPSFVWNGYAWDLASPGVYPASGLVPLQVKVLAAGTASIDFTNIDATYDEYEIHWHNVRHTADGSALCFRISQDNGATFKSAANYYMANSYVVPTSANSLAGSGATLQTQGQTGWATAGAAAYIGEMKFYRPWDPAMYKYIMHRGVAPGSAEHHYYDGYNVFFGDTAIINAIRFFPFSTTFAQGTFILYGRAKGPIQAVTPIGGRVLIATQTVTGAVATVPLTGIDNTYDEYEIHFMNVKHSSEQNTGLQISFDNGTTWKTDPSYVWGFHYVGYQSTSGDSQSIGQNMVSVAASQAIGAGNPGARGIIRLFNPSIATVLPMFHFETLSNGSSLGFTSVVGAGGYTGATGPTSAVRFIPFGGANITQGTFNLYGIKK